MDIEILHVPGCPNLGLARARLAAALEQTATAAAVHEVVVADHTRAHELGMHGSPTIPIDGPRPTPSPPDPGPLKCVWIPGADGRLECIWVPDWERDLRQASPGSAA